MSLHGGVLVTGSTGFIGRRLTGQLEERGYDVTRATGRVEDLPISNHACAVVVHLAGKSYVPASFEQPLDFYRTNVLGTLNVLDYCRTNGARLVYVSSYVYGQPRALPIGEDHPTQATNPYSHTKLLAEQCCEFFSRSFGVSCLVVRPFNVFGPGQSDRFLIPTLLGQIMDPQASVVAVADAEPRRDYLFVDDLVDLLIRAVSSRHEGVVNAASGHSYSVMEVFEFLASIAGRPGMRLVSRGERRPEEIMNVVGDVRRAKEVLGWRPMLDFKEGLERTVAPMAAGPAENSCHIERPSTLERPCRESGE